MSEPAANGSNWGTRLVGAIQVIGGGLEVALGVGGVVMPEPATTVGGIILVAHGSDTVIAGFRTLWTGEVQASVTQRAGTAAARGLGASPETARRVGVGVDVVAGIGPSIGIGVTRRLAIAGAEQATERVAVAYLHRSALQMGHNAVGVQVGETTAWVHFAGLPQGAVVPMTRAPGAQYVVTELAVTSQQAARAAAMQQILVARGTRTWSYLGPNCTTTAAAVLERAGVVVPAWSRTPYLLHVGVRAGPEITVLGGAAGTLIPGLLAPPARDPPPLLTVPWR